MSRIRSVALRSIYDSRGHRTVEATLTTTSGATGRAGAPSGASTGAHEVQALPAGGVEAAGRFVRDHLAPRLVGLEVTDQARFDAALHAADPSPLFERLGGNTATALSVAAALAAATEQGVPLHTLWRRPGVPEGSVPTIVGNCLNGGRHAIGGPDIQEFLAIASAPRAEDSVRAALDVHRRVGAALHQRFPQAALGRGDEGGWVAPVGNLDALQILTEACTAARDALGVEVHPGLDLAASEFFSEGRYRYREQTLDDEGQIGFLTSLVDRFGIRYLEDPFDEEAFEPFARLTREVGSRTLVVGDDLYTTNLTRLEQGISSGSSGAILIKVNQVGTLTDTLATVDRARAAGMRTVTSHRSGELPEGWLAHLAVGTGAWGLKCGLLGGERVAKLNELLRVGAPAGAP
jgi:enolase